MPRFIIKYQTTSYYSIAVDAESEEKAIQISEENEVELDDFYHEESGIELVSCEEISEDEPLGIPLFIQTEEGIVNANE